MFVMVNVRKYRKCGKRTIRVKVSGGMLANCVGLNCWAQNEQLADGTKKSR